MNYEEMSDNEINIAMTVKVFGCEGWELSEGGSQLFHCGIDGSGYFAQEIVDFCDSWADMGPLIVDYCICVNWLCDDLGVYANANQHIDDGLSCECKTTQYDHENPLRAAAIVYLMIKDSENHLSINPNP